MFARLLHRLGRHSWQEVDARWHSLDGRPPSLLSNAVFISEFRCRLCPAIGYGKLGHRVSFVADRPMTAHELKNIPERV